MVGEDDFWAIKKGDNKNEIRAEDTQTTRTTPYQKDTQRQTNGARSTKWGVSGRIRSTKKRSD